MEVRVINNFIKAIIFGIVEAVTEWLPISSTGHLLLLNQWVPLQVSPDFLEVFLVVIQLGAVLAVMVVYGKEFYPKNIKTNFPLWIKTCIATLPAILIALPLDDFIENKFYNSKTIAVTLIFYGIVFIFLEIKNRNKTFKISHISRLTYCQALFIGCFQLLALIPGTSRSGATIIGAMLLGISREVAAEFTFYLAIPVMFGASTFKIGKYLWSTPIHFTQNETALLFVGMAVACLVSIFVIQLFISFVKKHNFLPFGIYRIVLGCILLLLL